MLGKYPLGGGCPPTPHRAGSQATVLVQERGWVSKGTTSWAEWP